MKKYFVLFLILLASMSLFGCKKNTENTADIVTATSNKLHIELEGNATTGYQWTYSISDENIIICESEGYYPYKVDERIVGSGGQYIADFVAKADGNATIVLTYARSFEDGYARKKVIELVVSNGNIQILEEKEL